MTLPGLLRMLGYFFGICALVAIVKTALDTYQEGRQARWPSVVATITQQTVRQSLAKGRNSRGHYVWYTQSELRYSIDGEELTSSIRSRVTYSTEEGARMRKWASEHQPGTSLAVRYDPLHYNTVVTDAGDMPESGPQAQDDLKLIMVFLLPSIALVTTGRMLRRRLG